MLQIQTKYTPPAGQDPSNMPYDASLSIKDQVHASIASSLHNLRSSGGGAQYLDSVLLHSPLSSMTDTIEAWGVLGEYVNLGRIRHIGIANCPLSILKRLYGEVLPPAIVQNRFYPDTFYESDLRAYCRSQGIVFQSFWTLTGNPMLVTDTVVLDLARKVGVEEPVALYALVLGLKGISVLDGTTKEKRMVEDLMGVERVGEWAKGGETKVEWEDMMQRFTELLGEDSTASGDKV
jgi:diketogulonate reductase-like aldo/keto reductase